MIIERTVDHRFRLACRSVVLTLALFILVAMPSHALDRQPVGRIIAVSGTLVDSSGETAAKALDWGANIYQGQLLKTGNNSNAQLRFKDGALVAMRSDSELRIDEFHFDKRQVSKDRNTKTLLKGGIRVATGSIARRSPSAYRLRTSVATIGIRGTTYEAVLGDRLNVAVWRGGLRVENEQGTLDIGRGAEYDFAQVDSASQPPRGQLNPPPVFIGPAGSPEQVSGDTLDPAVEGIAEEAAVEGATGEATVEVTTEEATAEGTAAEEEETLLEPLLNPVATTDPSDTTTGTTGATGSGGSAGTSTTTTDLRLSATEQASLDRLGIISFAGVNARGFLGGKASDGAAGTPIITDNGLHPGEAGFDTTAAKYVVRRGTIGTSDITASDAGLNAAWGYWNGADQPIEIQPDPLDPTNIIYETKPSFWITMVPTPKTVLDSLTGTVVYGGTELGIQGAGSTGPVNPGNFNSSITVNFGTGAASGTMSISNGVDWNVSFTGQLAGPVIDINHGAVTGTVYKSPDTFSVHGDIGMMVTGSSGEAVGGVFDFEQQDDPGTYVTGQFLVR